MLGIESEFTVLILGEVKLIFTYDQSIAERKGMVRIISMSTIVTVKIMFACI